MRNNVTRTGRSFTYFHLNWPANVFRANRNFANRSWGPEGLGVLYSKIKHTHAFMYGNCKFILADFTFAVMLHNVSFLYGFTTWCRISVRVRSLFRRIHNKTKPFQKKKQHHNIVLYVCVCKFVLTWFGTEAGIIMEISRRFVRGAQHRLYAWGAVDGKSLTKRVINARRAFVTPIRFAERICRDDVYIYIIFRFFCACLSPFSFFCYSAWTQSLLTPAPYIHKCIYTYVSDVYASSARWTRPRIYLPRTVTRQKKKKLCAKIDM